MPCKGCEKRHPCCHCDCEAYKEADKERQRLKLAEKMENSYYWAGIKRSRQRYG